MQVIWLITYLFFDNVPSNPSPEICYHSCHTFIPSLFTTSRNFQKLQAEWLTDPSFLLRPNGRHYDGVQFLRKRLLGAVCWKWRQNNNLSRKCRQKCAHFLLWAGLMSSRLIGAPIRQDPWSGIGLKWVTQRVYI